MKKVLLLLVLFGMVTSCSINKHLKQDIKQESSEESTLEVQTVYLVDSSAIFENRILKKQIFELEQKISEQESKLNFTPNGGTLNFQTGEATGVISANIKTSVRENYLLQVKEELQDSISKINRLNLELTDSLAALKSDIKIETKTEIKTVVKTQFPWWLIPLTTLGTIAGIYILRRIPQVRAFMAIFKF
jgi:hypothetical protein